MKKLLILSFFILGFPPVALADEFWEDSTITTDDLVEFLKLKINKYEVEFDEPKLVTLHFQSPYQASTWSLKSPETRVSLVVYDPEGESEMTLRMRGETCGEAMMSFGSYDKESVKFRSIRYRGGLEIVGKEHEESKDLLFRLWVSTKDP